MVCMTQQVNRVVETLRNSHMVKFSKIRANDRQTFRLSAHTMSMIKTLLLFSSLALTSSAIIPVAFTALEKSTSQKVVILHDPNVKASMKQLGMMQALDESGVYGSEYEYVLCDVTLPQNIESVASVGFKEFPLTFTQTTDGGIEPFKGDLSTEKFATFHAFRTLVITSDNVERIKDSSGIGNVDGMTGLLKLAADRPVLVKMYEVFPFQSNP
jgi:hypothetical protein